jgi:hypothetical protein
MQKPKARTEYANEHDELMHTLDCLCWLTAEDMSLDLGISQEECADLVKLDVIEGRLVIDFDRAGDQVRLIPAPSPSTH